MDLSASDIVGVLDRVGIVAFAFSGVEAGFRRRFDIFGLLVMGLVTATGGGVMRDAMLGRVPLVLTREDYIFWAVGASALAIVIVWRRSEAIPRTIMTIADAGGLGAFAVAGALAAIQADLPVTAVVLMAMLTAAGGGVIRDIFADRIPQVLLTEVNATAAGLGGLAVWAFESSSSSAAALFGLVVAATVRIAGVAFNIHLPVPGMPRGR